MMETNEITKAVAINEKHSQTICEFIVTALHQTLVLSKLQVIDMYFDVKPLPPKIRNFCNYDYPAQINQQIIHCLAELLVLH